MEKSIVNIHEDLVARCRNEDQIAQYEIYKLYSRAMYNTALRITANHEDAEDVLQEAFINAFRNMSSYRGEAPFGAWLKRIVINKAITQLKKARKELMIISEAEVESPENVFDENEEYSVDAIKAAVNQLPNGFRSVLTLYLFEGYDHKEIAEILNIAESTSKTQYKRAKDKLKEILKKEVKYG